MKWTVIISLSLFNLMAMPVLAQTPQTQSKPRLGSKALGPMDENATRAMDSVSRSGLNVPAMVEGAGAAVKMQAQATALGSVGTAASVAGLGLLAAAAGGGGGGGSSGTTGTR
jgi:hypothetical protein